jgi:hypothetical protein
MLRRSEERPRRPRTPLDVWTSLRLAVMVLALWGIALLVLIDIDRLAALS